MMTTAETPTTTKPRLDTAQKNPDIGVLNQYYTDGDSADQEAFAEMRSSVLLVAGEHYTRKDSTFFKRIRDSKDLSKEQKLRLTKNHVRKICQIYANNISSTNPGVGFSPKDENSTHDQKASELHHSVWKDAFEKYNIDDKVDDWVDSFVQIGEVHVKIFWDEMAGPVVGYEPLTDETGQPSLDETGQPIADETKPVSEGRFVFEEIYGFNLLRPAENKDLRVAEWLCNRKMVDRQDLIRKFPSKEKFITMDQDETFPIFDITRGGYKQSSKRQTMLREYYFRPCLQFPNGYYYFTTKGGILAEGELPGGHFPIVSALFDKLQTTPRGRSPVKTMRPYQAEINRASSKMAEHQITLGDDKLLIQNGTKVSAGASLPGVRSIGYTGNEPKVLPGRDGSQYLPTIQQNITELYQVMMVAEDSEDNNDMKLDPYMLLYRAARTKKKFQRYIKRIEKFLIETVKLYLKLAKIHLPDDAVVWAIGKNEQVNLPEFRQLDDICYEINVEAQADDMETKLGKQLVLNHTLQYVGPQLQSDEIGKILRQMPYSNLDESFDDLMIDFDTAQNDVLALDRGEMPPIHQYDNHKYQIKRLTMRVRKADFKFLPQQVQKNYLDKIALHGQFEAKNAMEIQRAEQGLIPTSGYMAKVDLYVPDPKDATKNMRMEFPSDSLMWLQKQMEAQGSFINPMKELPQGAQAEVANMMTNSNPQTSGMT